MPKVKIHPLFIALLIILVITGYQMVFLNMILAVIIHELAHAKVARSRGYSLEKILLMPYGAVLSGREKIARDDAIAIYLAGPVFNAIIALFIIATWWLVPRTYTFTHSFALANIFLCAFNLLPLYPLDGSKIILNLASNKLKALSYIKTIGIIISLLMFIGFIFSAFGRLQITLGIISIFLFAGAVVGNNKERYHHLVSSAPFVKNLTDGISKNCVIISHTMSLFKILKFIKPNVSNTFIVVDNKGQTIKEIDENDLLIIFENNDITTKIGKVL